MELRGNNPEGAHQDDKELFLIDGILLWDQSRLCNFDQLVQDSLLDCQRGTYAGGQLAHAEAELVDSHDALLFNTVDFEEHAETSSDTGPCVERKHR